MKNKILAVLLALLLCISLAVCVSSQDVPPRLSDGADILTEKDELEILSELDRISTELSADVVVVTVTTTEDKSPMEFADDYFDYNGYGQGSDHSGVLLLIDMGGREMWISTTGLCIEAITDLDIENIFDMMEYDIDNENYAGAILTYAEYCEFYIDGAVNGYPTNYFFIAGVAIVVGLVIALIATGVMKGQLKSVRSRSEAGDYLKKGSLNLTRSSDMYLYRTVTREKLPEKSSSSSHTSSSGRSHGGGGRSF
ncbi:MAG: TPM domain-containing protein [Clostridia bacterium]|nr:TPM domain-containing protein [Clostridia bacterium]